MVFIDSDRGTQQYRHLSAVLFVPAHSTPACVRYHVRLRLGTHCPDYIVINGKLKGTPRVNIIFDSITDYAVSYIDTTIQQSAIHYMQF